VVFALEVAAWESAGLDHWHVSFSLRVVDDSARFRIVAVAAIGSTLLLEGPSEVWTSRFEADRRSDAVRDRVRDDFREVRQGWRRPTLFAAGERHTSPLDLSALERLIQQPS